MRYSADLRTSRKHHILKKHRTSSLVSLIALGVPIVLLIALVGVSHLDASKFFSGFVASLARVSAAYVISAILATVLALLITAHRWIENLLLPVFDVLQSFPSFALFPVLVVALEHEPETVIVMVLVITMIWPILFSIVGGIKNRRGDLEEAATIFGARGWRRLRYFTIPELLPAIVTGSIVGWGEAWEFIIGAELLVAVHRGIGHYLGELGTAHQSGLLLLGITAFMLLLFVINKLVWLPLLARATRYQTES